MTTIKLLAQTLASATSLTTAMLMQSIKRKRSKWVSERELRRMRKHIAEAKSLAKASR